MLICASFSWITIHSRWFLQPLMYQLQPTGYSFKGSNGVRNYRLLYSPGKQLKTWIWNLKIIRPANYLPKHPRMLGDIPYTHTLHSEYSTSSPTDLATPWKLSMQQEMLHGRFGWKKFRWEPSLTIHIDLRWWIIATWLWLSPRVMIYRYKAN